ncbi:MAG: hypothetical protein RR576_11770 [Oscillospiraceae bacterium]
MSDTEKMQNAKKIEIEVKMHINQRLFDDKLITEEMYRKAKDIILKS